MIEPPKLVPPKLVIKPPKLVYWRLDQMIKPPKLACFPEEAFQTCPTGRSQKNQWTWLWRGWFGFPFSGRCPHDPDPDRQ